MRSLKSKAFAAKRPLLHPLSHAVISALCCFYAGQALALDAGALPTNGQVTDGSGSISQAGNVMTVTQNSDRMVATFSTYNVGSGAQVNYLQPSSSSVALNRVTSGDASQIMGQINANGQVYLINPSGILFGQGAAVNVGGLVASALPISDANFMAGNAVFDASGSAPGTVINKGTITAADGGYVALLGAQVRNEGVVIARLGRIMLGAGEKVTLDFNGDGLINMEVNDAAAGAAATNQGLLQANGGTVIMSARSSDALLSNVVNNEGVIEATSLQNRNGTVLLDGGNAGIVAVSGTIDVSGRDAGETGGTVKALGQYVGVFDGARIDASGDAGGGTVLIGGNYQGSGTEHQADSTFMAANASIRADAIHSGNGGKVVLWSTGSTDFYGDISVLGGGQSGAGGVVETSGHDLEALGSVNLSAASGRGGSWLIDPTTINISSAANANISLSSPFQPSGSTTSILSSATLNSSLSEGASVVVRTANGTGTTGDINVLDNIQGVGNASLTLQADRSITMTGKTISSGTGKTLNVSLFSDSGGGSNGSVTLTDSVISTNGGAFTISGGSNPTTGYASTNQSGTAGISLSNTSISSSGGDITIRGATTGSSNSNATQIVARSLLNAGGGNISIVGNVAATGTGEAMIITGGSSITTSGGGNIGITGVNLGSGNATRIFSTNNTIAATGSGNVTITGTAASGFGVLICSTSATTVQSIGTGSGTLTIQGSAAGRAVYLAAGAAGAINLNSSAGGNIVVNGASTGSYGVILNATGAGAVIGIATAGDITVTGSTSGGTTPALGLSSGGAGTSRATASQINIASSGNGNVLLKANNTVVSSGGGALRGLFLDASAAFASINIGSQAGSLTLDGTSTSGRGVDIAPSASTAAVNISTASGPILISGNSTGSYGILFNSTGASTVASTSGDITLNGTTGGSGEAVSVIGTGSSATNTIATGGSGNMNISAIGGGYGLHFNGGTNNLTVVDGALFIKARAAGGTAFGQSADVTTIAATGAGSVIKDFGGQLSSILTDPTTASTTTSVQSAMTGGDWMAPISDDVTSAASGTSVPNGAGFATSPLNDGAGKVSVSVQSDNSNNPGNPGTGKQNDTF